MKVYFITRFSIYDPTATSWKTSKLPQNQYKKILFSKSRLDAKFLAFIKMTLPSIINQTNKNYEWIIMSSIYLPDNYKKLLNKLVAPYPQIKLYYIKDSKEFSNILKKYPFEKNYATVRIDDDDGLSTKYVHLVQQYHQKKGSIVTFPYGRNFKIENNKIIIKKIEKFYPQIALGLCAINMNIYGCGNHSFLHKKYKIIRNNTKDMYNVFCSPFCDTKRKF